MGLELRMDLSVRMEQKLVMTQQLQMAIRLLQLTRQEMSEEIVEQLEQNPVLEEVSPITSEPQETETKEGEGKLGEIRAEDSPPEEPQAGETESGEFDWENYFENYTLSQSTTTVKGGMDELPSFEATVSSSETLSEHLLWQLNLAFFSEDEREMAALLIGNLREDGWLVAEDDEDPLAGPTRQMFERDRSAAESRGETWDEAEAEERMEYWSEVAVDALEGIQEMDPAGIGARNLRECLLLQAEQLELSDPELVCTLIRDHLQDLEKRNFQAIGKALKVSVKELLEVSKLISRLDPKPGRNFTGEAAPYITPDIHIHKIGDDYHVVLNEDGLPKLRISDRYRQELKKGKDAKETKNYIKEKLKSAAWFIRSIHQRQQTILKVTESIVERQKEFLAHGVSRLKPMVLRDVAEDIGMHESTVSRVTTGKYVQTPQGIFELKYFFTPKLTSTHGGSDVSSAAVKERIRVLVSEEPPGKPLSDQAIVKILKKEGVKVARRTVAKYRDALRIPSSSKRKRIM